VNDWRFGSPIGENPEIWSRIGKYPEVGSQIMKFPEIWSRIGECPEIGSRIGKSPEILDGLNTEISPIEDNDCPSYVWEVQHLKYVEISWKFVSHFLEKMRYFFISDNRSSCWNRLAFSWLTDVLLSIYKSDKPACHWQLYGDSYFGLYTSCAWLLFNVFIEELNVCRSSL
jgi:hypothetical protein